MITDLNISTLFMLFNNPSEFVTKSLKRNGYENVMPDAGYP